MRRTDPGLAQSRLHLDKALVPQRRFGEVGKLQVRDEAWDGLADGLHDDGQDGLAGCLSEGALADAFVRVQPVVRQAQEHGLTGGVVAVEP